MNWESIGVIAEVVGAIAVVISLGYLAIQVRSNTRALKASSSFDATHSWAATNELLVSAIAAESDFQTSGNSRLVDISAKFYNPETKPGDMTDTETVLMSMIHRVLFQKLEGQYYQFKHGYAEPQIWVARRDWARGILALPMGREWWNEEQKSSIYSSEFASIISNSLEADVTVKLAGLRDSQ
jgi:hypothetical protein